MSGNAHNPPLGTENPDASEHQRLGLRSHGPMHGSEEDLVVKRFNEKADCPCPDCLVSHRVVVVCCNDDDACPGRNGLEPLLDFKAACTWHPDINHRESHRIAPGVREKTEWLMEQLRLQADG